MSHVIVAPLVWSRPSQGAWIETYVLQLPGNPVAGRAPRKARGLKHPQLLEYVLTLGRAPRKARGLKLHSNITVEKVRLVFTLFACLQWFTVSDSVIRSPTCC